MLKVGDKAPDFILSDQNDNKISLSDYKNKKIVLWFYPKASTPGWIIEGKGFRDEFQKFEEKNIQILGCSADPVKKQLKFCDKQGFQYPLLSDENHEMLEAYGVWGKKKFMGREYMGIKRMSFIIGKDGKLKHVMEKVNTKTHHDDVLEILSEKK